MLRMETEREREKREMETQQTADEGEKKVAKKSVRGIFPGVRLCALLIVIDDDSPTGPQTEMREIIPAAGPRQRAVFVRRADP